MHNISDYNTEGLPSSASLIKATIIAAVIGLAILFTMVMPAEYGIDPTGLGKQLGLTQLNTATVDQEVEAPIENLLDSSGGSISPVLKSSAKYRSDTMKITLKPDEGTEVKALMKQEEQLLFSWTVDNGAVNFDMHGEPLGDTNTFSSYWKGAKQTSAHGGFVAPFEGTHGWYWQNPTESTVTISLSTSGFYQKIYQP